MEAAGIFMTRETVIFLVLLAVLTGLLVYYRRWEGRRMRQKTLDAMSPELRNEIEEERQINQEKKQKFEEAMKKAGNP